MPAAPPVSNCKYPRCCRGVKHPRESNPDNVFACRNCGTNIDRTNLGNDGGCQMCGACAKLLSRCGHCCKVFGTT